MANKKAILWGCSAALFVALVGVIVVVLFVVHVSKNVEGVAVSVNTPSDVTVGQTFQLEVVIKNVRPRKALKLSDVDISDKYLSGFSVVSAVPPHKSSMHVPMDNSQSFTFDISLPAGASTNIVFNLRAEKAGLFRGDVDVCEGTRFITDMAQTVVKEKQ